MKALTSLFAAALASAACLGADGITETSAPRKSAMSLVIDAYAGFTQTVSNQTHTMDGPIAVRNGALRVAGTARFTNVKEITVGESASLEISSTSADPFPSLRTVSVDGSLLAAGVADGCDLMADVSLSLGANARLTLPQSSTQTVREPLFGGRPIVPGVHTAETLPCLNDGATLLVTSIAQGSSAVWSGAAEGDNLMATPGNWQGPPESIDVASGALGVTVAGGGEVVVPLSGTVISVR